MDIKRLVQCLVVIKLYSGDLTVFLLVNLDPSYFTACHPLYHVLLFLKLSEFIAPVYSLVITKLYSAICIPKHRTF